MPRSGSTLVESIISMKTNVDDLGEINIFEESFLEWRNLRNSVDSKSLSSLYYSRIKSFKNNVSTTTNKWLYNYQYAGMIATQIPNAKIIHCYRNPLDNILSIFRAHFANRNYYSSSLSDCAKVYLDQEKLMDKYKKKYRSNIYDLNYDLLVTNPDDQIRSLISWLNWEWDNSYLSPHLNMRSVSTASNVQVRSPINTKSIGGWKNYREMLEPAKRLITQYEKYGDLT